MANIFDDVSVSVSPIIIARDKVENLTDRPNTNKEFGGDGMTGGDLKKAFDKIGIYVATRLKNLTEMLKSADAGGSIGIKGWNDEVTTIKSMLMELKATTGASKIGTGMAIKGVTANLQVVIDDLYKLISSYELDDIYDIKLGLQYDKATGECGKLNSMTANLNTLNDYVEKLNTLIGVNVDGTTAVRLDNIESDISALVQSKNSALGLATLNGVGKLNNEVDASKITSGILPLSCIPDAAFERVFEVATDEARFKLTKTQVQNGDIVIVTANPDKWFKVINDEKLNLADGYREIIGGTTAQAQMAKEYDVNYKKANSIAAKFDNLCGVGRSTETLKGNAEAIEALKGVAWNGQTLKSNAIEIDDLKAMKNKFFKNVTVNLYSFGASSRYKEYEAFCNVNLSNVVETDTAEVILSHEDAVSAIFSPIVDVYNGGIRLYAKEIPKAPITISKIIIFKEG